VQPGVPRVFGAAPLPGRGPCISLEERMDWKARDKEILP